MPLTKNSFVSALFFWPEVSSLLEIPVCVSRSCLVGHSRLCLWDQSSALPRKAAYP